MLEQLRAILSAETLARQQFDAAHEESSRLVRQAEADARQQERAAREAREAVSRAVEDRIIAEAQLEASRILAEASASAAAMRAAAQPRMSQAVEAVIRCLLGPEDDHDR